MWQMDQMDQMDFQGKPLPKIKFNQKHLQESTFSRWKRDFKN